jgi:HK97 family phage prohead protease
MKRITRDAFDKYREQMGAEYVDDILAKLGLGPKYVAPEKQLFKCARCGGENAYWHEFGADCDAGQNYMALYCPDCGHEDENPKKQIMKPLTEEFGDRLVTLHTGAVGLRGGIISEVKAVADDESCLDFIGSDNRVDRYGEVIEQDGWDTKNFLANPVIPDCHDYSSVARILGRAKSLAVKDVAGRKALHNRVSFAMDNPLGAMAFKMASKGFIPAQSVGFIPLTWTNGVGKDQPARTYKKCELLEISLVVVPANPGATNQITKALNEGAINKSDLRACAEFFKQFCSGQGDDEAKARATGSSVHFAQLLSIGRATTAALKHT